MDQNHSNQMQPKHVAVHTLPLKKTTISYKLRDRTALLKYLSLVTLCVQNAAIYLMMRYVRSRSHHTFTISVAVVVSEVMKVATCLVVILVEKRSLTKMAVDVYKHTIKEPRDCLKIAVPSLLYVVQNNLLYVALSNLDAVTFQVLYQFKILTTAVFSVLLLKKSLISTQWLALTILFIGVTVVQIDIAKHKEPHTKDANIQQPMVGVMAAAVGSLVSGFAGVFLEKILKGTRPSIFMRNVQLGSLGIVISSATMIYTDGSTVRESGLFVGFDWLVWLVICIHSLGGLLTAAVMKYADNILKGYAFAISILASTVISYFCLDFYVDVMFLLGTTAVIVSVLMYGIKRPNDNQLTTTNEPNTKQ